MPTKPKAKPRPSGASLPRLSPVELPAGCEPLLSIDQLCALLAIRKRTFFDLRAREAFPAPDADLNGRPRWRASTYNAWLEGRTRARRVQDA